MLVIIHKRQPDGWTVEVKPQNLFGYTAGISLPNFPVPAIPYTVDYSEPGTIYIDNPNNTDFPSIYFEKDHPANCKC